MQNLKFLLPALSLFIAAASQGASLPREKLASLCSAPLQNPLYGMWHLNKDACDSAEMKSMVSNYAIVLPGSTAEVLEVYVSDTVDFASYQTPSATLMEFSSLFAVIHYPVDANNFYDLIFQIDHDGTDAHLHGFKNWDSQQFITFGNPGGEHYGCKTPGL